MVERSRRVENRLNRLGTRVLDVLGRQEWLDRPSYRFEHALTFVFNTLGGARERVTNVLHGVWLGHPLHPPLASLSTGSIGTTVALDVVREVRVLAGRPAFELRDVSRFARRALTVGILANIGAAVTGVTDWQHTHEQSRRIGLVHGVLNTVAMGLYALSWWERRRGRHRRGVIDSALGYGITMASGYLGGAMVFGSGVGMDQSGKRLGLDEWTPVLPIEELPEDRPHRVGVDGVGLILYRSGQQVSAVGEFCPHLAAPMADGWIDRGRIVCPWHGSRFDVDSGEVLRGPAAAPLPCYQTRLVDGMVELRGGEQNPVRVGKGVAL
ncbi:MAG: Rieske 2Fe-2S domain-containing protein [Mycobacterium sp.]